MSVERNVDELFALPPEEFISERDRLARELKSGGDAEAAKLVKALRRPTVAAWAINQLVRSKSGVNELIELAGELRKAQRGALSGLRGGALREGIKRRRAVVDGLADRAVDILDAAGRNGQTQREAIVRTLEAATADPDAAEAVRTGRLERELERPSGFGDVGGLVAVPSAKDEDEGDEPRAGRSKRGPKKEAKQAAPREDPRLKRLRNQRDESADEARAAATAAVRAGERAVKAEAEADRARAEIERMERDLRAAKRRERDSAQTAVEAAAAVRKAEQGAERARKRVEDVQARLEKLLSGS